MGGFFGIWGPILGHPRIWKRPDSTHLLSPQQKCSSRLGSLSYARAALCLQHTQHWFRVFLPTCSSAAWDIQGAWSPAAKTKKNKKQKTKTTVSGKLGTLAW